MPKRQMRQAPEVVDATTQSLQCIGMRIRQSVSGGYQLPPLREDSYVPRQQVINQQTQRVPFPSHLQNQPPALDFNSSTASSLSCWEDEIDKSTAHMQTLINERNTKRSRDQYEDKQLSDYQTQYGALTFNEEF